MILEFDTFVSMGYGSALLRQSARKPRLLEHVSNACRARQFSRRTEEAYRGWIRNV